MSQTLVQKSSGNYRGAREEEAPEVLGRVGAESADRAGARFFPL